ncbi:Flp pilus assembly protein CpaB [Pinisolibacter sp.]|uniref:Flp pilus assembly protein CpaB n=1 Tax=Pinisolibacter sp. TaxID=2172024 RepID=UPI002FDD92BD
MKVTRLLVLAIALGAGIVAAMLAVKMSNREPAPVPVAAVPAEAPRLDTIDVLVASKDISLGYRIAAGDLVWQSFPKTGVAEVYVNRIAQPNADQELVGTVARSPFLTGEPVRAQRLIKADRGFMSVILSPGMRASAVEVKAVSTAGGFILPNDHVDVILTRAAPKGASGGGDPYVSETVLNNIRVLAVDQQLSDGKPDTAAMLAKDTVTLELTPRQAEVMAQSTQLGVISLALRSLRDRDGTPIEEETESSGGSVKMVRFGVQSTVSMRR